MGAGQLGASWVSLPRKALRLFRRMDGGISISLTQGLTAISNWDPKMVSILFVPICVSRFARKNWHKRNVQCSCGGIFDSMLFPTPHPRGGNNGLGLL